MTPQLELVVIYEQVYGMFTLASLLDKKENFRLHLFIRPSVWDKRVVEFALANFTKVNIYQMPQMGREHMEARATLQLKEHWKDKSPGLGKRVVISSGNRLFLTNLDEGQLPPEKYFDNKLSLLCRTHKWITHNHFQSYYNLLGLRSQKKDLDKKLFFLNWDSFSKMNNNDTFFRGGIVKPTPYTGYYADQERTEPLPPLADIDQYILNADTKMLFSALLKNNHVYTPLYINGKDDELLRHEAVGPKDAFNYNLMLRKSWSIEMPRSVLNCPYHVLPTIYQLAVPFDQWSSLIDKIPLNLRNASLNEVLLIKSDNQKRYLRKVVEAGYQLGKMG